MRLGFIGFGEAGFEISKGLMEHGVDQIVVYDAQFEHELYGALVQERVAISKVTLLESARDVVEQSDVIFVTVPVDKTLEVFETLKDDLRKGMLYVDLTASIPNVKKEMGDQLKDRHVHVIDGAIMGPVVMQGHAVPILVSGSKSEQLAQHLNEYGMKVKTVSDCAGDASAIKLTRSIYMKSMSTVLIETLEAAEEFGIADYVIDSLANTMDQTDFKSTVNRLVTGTAIHAYRRSKELEGSVSMLSASNIDHSMASASKGKLEDIANTNIKEHFKSKTPKSWTEVIHYLKSGGKG